MRLYARYQLARAERLCHVIIRAQSESPDLIDVILLCRHHNDRRVFPHPDLAADFKTIYAGKHQIQNDQIKFLLQGTLQPRLTVIFYLHRKSGKFQIIFLQIGNRHFIFYDQNLTHLQAPPDIF